uniref:G-protein coupled receptors family 1 profile domain-containing protein n=1 Tax=Sphenodon punctatus TaxID=8508 RepID=A0A8D0GUW5_SPHPU
MSNQSTVTDFLLLEFSEIRELQILYFVLFLMIYLAALAGNLLIIIVVAHNHHLHTPMYFFLVNLSFLDLCYISVTVPNSMSNSLMSTRQISFLGCVSQVFWGLAFAAAEMALFTVMAYDRYAAICHPLHYTVIMNRTACAHMVTGCWLSSLIYSALHTANTFRLPFCSSNIINQFFCDLPQLLKLSCSDTSTNAIVIIVCGAFFGFIFFASIFASYACIFSMVLKIPSSQGRNKAFSTCLPHLMVFSLFMVTGMFTYMRQSSESSPYVDVLAAVLYSVVSPVVNPMIYSLRNKEIKEALGKISIKTLLYGHWKGELVEKVRKAERAL